MAISKLLASIGIESTRRQIGADRSAWIEISFSELKKRFAAKGWIHPTDEIPESEHCLLDDVYDDSAEVDDKPSEVDGPEPAVVNDEPEVAVVDDEPTAAPEPTAVDEPAAVYFSDLISELLSDDPIAPEPPAVNEPATIDFAVLMDAILTDLDS